jgi:Uma2 family endonuclease
VVNTVTGPTDPTETLPPAAQPFRWTRALYAQLREAGILGEDDRVELVEGELVEMAAVGAPHNVAVGLADDVLRETFGRGFHVQVQGPMALGDTSEPEPDVAVIPGNRRDYTHDHPTTAALVIEVADTSLRYDRERKASLYARAGIAEYWIVNLVERVIEVHREPAPDRTAPFGASYTRRMIVEVDGNIAPLAAPDRPVRVSALLP